MSTTRTRLGALVTAGVLTFGLAACGGDDEPETTPTTAVEEGGDATEDTDAPDDSDTSADEGADEDGAGDTAAEDTSEEDAGSGDVTEGEEIPVEDFMAKLQEPGEETLSRYTMSMAMDVEGQQSTMEGAVDLSGESPRMQIAMTVAEMGGMDLIYADGETYMSMPGLTPEGMYLLAPQELVGDAADLDEIDISTQWETWEEGAQSVVFMGEEDVDGETMERYQVTVDAEALESSLEGDAAAATSLGLDEDIVYDIWLDADSLMRKMSFDVDGQLFEMFMDNWGEEQDIQVPGPDEIMEMDELGTGGTG